jgi:GntR family transcriptional regulator, transcriptional repressor for pyruvate dehydrogenase complex
LRGDRTRNDGRVPTRPPLTSVERVIGWLRGHIARGRLGIGDPLPKELEIAAAVGVARSSVREALTGLKVLGIIESRRRGGIRIVRDPVLLELREWFSGQYSSPDMIRDALEFRISLERGAAELVARRIAPEEVARLRKLSDQLPADAPPEAVVAAEKTFHTTLARGAGNDLVRLMSALFAVSFDSAPRVPAASGAGWRRDHEAIISALERRDIPAFARLMHAHTVMYLDEDPPSAPIRKR